jgi:hypothetical protein
MYRRDGAVCPVHAIQASAAEGAGKGDIRFASLRRQRQTGL